MAASQALIPYDCHSKNAVAKIEQDPRSGWALVLDALRNPSPGRTLEQVYLGLGKVAEKQANRVAYTLGLGPHVIARKLTSYFGNGEERVERLKLLRTSVPPKLKKQCLKLVKYTLPTESANTQCQAFGEIVNLVTLFAELRGTLLRAKFLDGATSVDTISPLWDRPGATGPEWEFWKTLAATCLSESNISAMVEVRRTPELTKCGRDGLSVIECLLIGLGCSGVSEPSGGLCIRYLSGILALPGFWLDRGSVHADVAHKLCRELIRVLKDIGVDVLVLGPIDKSEPIFNYEGVDLLASTLLTGISSWFGGLSEEDWILQPWFDSCGDVVRLLRRPRAAELLPLSSDCATRNFAHFPTAYEDVQLNIVVDSDGTTADNLNTARDDSRADLQNRNNSTTSIHSQNSDQNDIHTVGSLDDDHHDPQTEESDRDSTLGLSQNEASISENENPDSFDISADDAEELKSGPRYSQRTDSNEGPDSGDSEIDETASRHGASNSTPYRSLETLAKDLETALLDKQGGHADKGSLDDAEEALPSVLHMDKGLDFDTADEILFRTGIIYKQQGKYEDSLGCFDRILKNPPSPLTQADIWFQIGHVHEQQKDYVRAKDAYEYILRNDPNDVKALQQLGWLYQQDGSPFHNQDLAIQYFTKSLEVDATDAEGWYLLGRTYMGCQQYNKAYEAYQQAVYRDGRNPTFWCSIGVLYFQINQYRDALDAYSRAIRLNPYISEVWVDLGSLYENCNNQISDAIDAYTRASELDPDNPIVSQRLTLLKDGQVPPATLNLQDVHPVHECGRSPVWTYRAGATKLGLWAHSICHGFAV
ncbi:hypothetical protein K438DRAFT_1796675 [Mycena galopus ATCC 62051]|nr:hypothetical protein K438DRAFT_1796675 [Mycena galopus ATCC 62051]